MAAKGLGLKISNKICDYIGSWSFIGIYTLSMIAWMALHLAGYLDLDTKDFMRWNLWLSYFAGIQASIVLMVSNRQVEKDRKMNKENLLRTQHADDVISGLEEEIKSLKMKLEEKIA